MPSKPTVTKAKEKANNLTFRPTVGRPPKRPGAAVDAGTRLYSQWKEKRQQKAAEPSKSLRTFKDKRDWIRQKLDVAAV